MDYRTLGRTGLSVSPVCVGTSSLGSPPAPHGTDTAVATIRRVFDGPFNFVDTSNEYGNGGNSERRIGQALAEAGGLPEGFVVATKVDPIVGTSDYSGDRVRIPLKDLPEAFASQDRPFAPTAGVHRTAALIPMGSRGV